MSDDLFSPTGARKYWRDHRLLHLIRRRRDFHWIVGVLLSPPLVKQVGLQRMVSALIQVVGPDALKKEVVRQCKKDNNRPSKPIPGEALRVRALWRENPHWNRSQAVREVLGIDTNHPCYKSIYDALNNSKKLNQIDQILDSFPAGSLPEDLPAPILDSEELFRQCPD
jgi:hypothetical protein